MYIPISLYEAVLIFLIYGFMGWCVEVAYAAFATKKFVNRGFLNSPICPIYGVGVLVVIIVLTPIKESFIILFLGSVIVTTIIEFVTGFILEKLFKNKWWDYSNQAFNICGYVCLKFSILWGLACSFIIKIINPAIYEIIHIIPYVLGIIIIVISLSVFIIDLCITVASILNFNKRLSLMDEVAEKLKILSNEIGENIYENVTDVVEKSEEWKETVDEKIEIVKESLEVKKEEILSLQTKYKELMENKNSIQRRLIKAFPNMKSIKYQESLNKIKVFINENKIFGKGKNNDT